MRFILLLVLVGCGVSAADSASVCPAPTDPCMNEDNYQECLDAEASCTGNLVLLESCPLQFGCDS